MSNERVLNNGTMQTTHKCSHNTVDKFASFVHSHRICNSPPLAPLTQRRKHDHHVRVPVVKLVQVLLHPVYKLDAAGLAQVVAATVDEEDIRCCSSSQGVAKKGDKAPPPQSTYAEPADADVGQAQVASCCLCSSLGTTSDIAVPDYPNCCYGKTKSNCFR